MNLTCNKKNKNKTHASTSDIIAHFEKMKIKISETEVNVLCKEISSVMPTAWVYNYGFSNSFFITVLMNTLRTVGDKSLTKQLTFVDNELSKLSESLCYIDAAHKVGKEEAYILTDGLVHSINTTYMVHYARNEGVDGFIVDTNNKTEKPTYRIAQNVVSRNSIYYIYFLLLIVSKKLKVDDRNLPKFVMSDLSAITRVDFVKQQFESA